MQHRCFDAFMSVLQSVVVTIIIVIIIIIIIIIAIITCECGVVMRFCRICLRVYVFIIYILFV